MDVANINQREVSSQVAVSARKLRFQRNLLMFVIHEFRGPCVGEAVLRPGDENPEREEVRAASNEAHPGNRWRAQVLACWYKDSRCSKMPYLVAWQRPKCLSCLFARQGRSWRALLGHAGLLRREMLWEAPPQSRGPRAKRKHTLTPCSNLRGLCPGHNNSP